MHLVAERLIFSATDLSNFLACPHLSLLERRTALGGPKPPYFEDPGLEVLRVRGHEHERNYLADLQRNGRNVLEIREPARELPRDKWWRQYAAATAEAMRAGVDAIYQAALFDGTWAGKPDFLLRVERASELGAWSYEVVDTKLAREAKGGALLQVLLYSDLLAEVQGVAPEFVHLALGGPQARTESFRVTEYAAYFRSVRRRFLEHIAAAPKDVPVAPEPVAHCDICEWRPVCERERHDVDHLSLVAGITGRQRRALAEQGVHTVAALAEFDPGMMPSLDGVSRHALERIHAQARIQVDGRRSGQPRHELILPLLEAQGIAALPPPSPGDLFFDIEGDPYALTHGIEYLFGFVDANGEYAGRWALDREQEKRAFQEFIDFVMARLRDYPDLHIYHYAAYDPTALKRLMGRYATREDEVDQLLRGEVLVDLYRVVRQGVRASVESYSIKRLEPFYGFERAAELPVATRALAEFEAWLELGGKREDDLPRIIEVYNRDDCLSAWKLRDWLESLRSEHERATGEPIPRPTLASPEPSETVAARQREVAALMERLLVDVPADAEARAPEQHARWLMAQLLEFHRREKKSMWWEYFRRLQLNENELIEDRSTIGGLEYVGEAGSIKRSVIHRYRFPPQEHGFDSGDRAIDPATEKSVGAILRIDDMECVLELKRGRDSRASHPRALIPDENVGDETLRDGVLGVGYAVAEHGLGAANPYRSAVDLLLRNTPRAGQAPGEGLVRPGEAALDAAIRLVATLDGSVLPIQGPPGAGKTYTAARTIVNELRAGQRVGITATSHKVISKLLEEVCEAANEAGYGVKGIQKAEEDQECGLEQIAATKKNEEVRAALANGEVLLAAGTAWLWSREDMVGSVDVLFVDEAGQFSLANAIAVAPAAKNLVLVGDPRQLEQPQQGVHPPGSDVSALDHLLGGAATIPEDRGIFLGETWRLHPELTAFTSEMFYEGRLQSRAGLERQEVRAVAPVHGTGLRLLAVEHVGNQNESAEEVEPVAGLVQRVVGGGYTWVDRNGETKPLRLEDILIIAPYNAQVSALAARLPGARVGTVDKFQGQEAAIVIYSLATSTPADAPRGMSFLYSPNRLNVATSRAKCVAVVVASRALFTPDCRTPEQMRLANPFCRFVELARTG